MIALRRENADLEAACEQAREELQMAVARAEKAEQQAAQTPACPEVEKLSVELLRRFDEMMQE